MSDQDYAAVGRPVGRPDFGGPLHIGGAAKAVEAAAEEARKAAEVHKRIALELESMVKAFRARFKWFFPA